MRRCFICGNPAVMGSLCKDCFRHQNPPITHVAPLIIKACQHCPALQSDNKWIYEPTPDTIPSIVRKRIKHSSEYALKEMTVRPISDVEKGFHPVQYEVKMILGAKGHEFEHTYELPIQFDGAHCDHCMKANSTYYEGTLQVRSISAIVEEVIDQEIAKGEKEGNFLIKKVAHKDGFDYFFTKNRFTLQLGQTLRKMFGGTMSTSRRLHTRSRQSSKDLYRVTVLYEPPLFFKGEVIEIAGKVYLVLSTTQDIKAKDLDTQKTEILSPKIKRFTRLIPYTTKVTRQYPNLEAMHPISYQSVPVHNAHEHKKLGERVRVVFKDESAVYFF